MLPALLLAAITPLSSRTLKRDVLYVTDSSNVELRTSADALPRRLAGLSPTQTRPKISATPNLDQIHSKHVSTEPNYMRCVTSIEKIYIITFIYLFEIKR
jgi:hypothetical protein